MNPYVGYILYRGLVLMQKATWWWNELLQVDSQHNLRCSIMDDASKI